MKSKSSTGLTRREAMGSIAGLTALMLNGSFLNQVYAQQGELSSDPRYTFTDIVAELVIPETDTPGAGAVSVAAFVLLAVDTGMSDLQPVMLERFRNAMDSESGGNFLTLSNTRQNDVLGAFDARAFSAEPETGSPAHAWRRIKSAIVAAYYTSEIGAGQELVYEAVPGRFENITLSPDYRDRSNNGFGGAI